MNGSVNDELMMPCAQCCRKHLSAAVSYYACSGDESPRYSSLVFARAMVNLCEATEGYESHYVFARGLFVQAEEAAEDADTRRKIREFRLAVDRGEWPIVPPDLSPSCIDMYLAHVAEAEREYPDIRFAVEREPFYRDNMSELEGRQAEVSYRLAQIRWLEENVFGYKPKEKGEEQMACAKKPAKAAKASAKKAACKGGKCKSKSGCKK